MNAGVVCSCEDARCVQKELTSEFLPQPENTTSGVPTMAVATRTLFNIISRKKSKPAARSRSCAKAQTRPSEQKAPADNLAFVQIFLRGRPLNAGARPGVPSEIRQSSFPPSSPEQLAEWLRAVRLRVKHRSCQMQRTRLSSRRRVGWTR